MSTPLRQKLRRGLRSLGLEVQTTRGANLEPQVLKAVMDLAGVETVIDVGANIGQYGDQLLRIGFRGTVLSFEPVPEVHRTLTAHALSAAAQWLVGPCVALGSRAGETTFNVAAGSECSGVLPVLDTHLRAAPQSRCDRRITVPVQRLDWLVPSLLPSASNLLIKVDTQGYELEVLRGCEGLFGITVALQLELSLMSLFQGAPLFMEVISHVQSRGFELFNLLPGFREESTKRLQQVDGFFVRKELLAEH